MKVAIVGSREPGSFTVLRMLDEIPRNCTELVSGGAKGIDAMARECAELLHIPCKEFLPDYAHLGRGAPHARNLQIIAYADLVLAFWDFSSHGTRDTILACQKQGVPCKIIDIRDRPRQFLSQSRPCPD